MNDYREADFVAQEMLPSGNYQGRLTVGVAQHLQRRLPSVTMPSSLVLDIQVESTIAFRIWIQALARKQLKELRFSCSLPLACVAVLAETFTPCQLQVLDIQVEGPAPTTPHADIACVFRRLAKLCTRNLHLGLLTWDDIDAVLRGLDASRTPTTHHPRVTLSLAYYNAFMWDKQASQIQAHHFVHGVTIQGGLWGPDAWNGLIRCLQTSSIRSLALQGTSFLDQPVRRTTVRALQEALCTTKIREFQLVNIQGTAREGSLALVQTLLASMVSHEHDEEDVTTHAFWISDPVCSVRSLTLKSRAYAMVDDDFLCALHGLLAEHLPRMRKLRTLHTRWHPSTSGPLWQAIQANGSLTTVSAGKAVGRMLEPVLQRNRLLRATQTHCRTWRTLEEVVDFAQDHSIVMASDAIDPARDMITASAAYWLVRSCVPHNCRRACGDGIVTPLRPPARGAVAMITDDESTEWEEDSVSQQNDSVDMMIVDS